jgi:hypothetical protein
VTDEERQLVDDTISDCVARFLYYDRKEDDELPVVRLCAITATDDGLAYVIGCFAQHLLAGRG